MLADYVGRRTEIQGTVRASFESIVWRLHALNYQGNGIWQNVGLKQKAEVFLVVNSIMSKVRALRDDRNYFKKS